MKRFGIVFALVAVLGALGSSSACACDYSINLFNHRLDGDKLRLYFEMRTAMGLPLTTGVEAARFDTLHNPGDATLTDVGTYQNKGNGLATLLMLDRSGSMKRLQAQEREAAIQYIDSMDPRDLVGLYLFALDASIHPFSDNPGELRSAIHKEIRGEKPTPMPGDVTPLFKHLIDGINKIAAEAQRELSFVLVMTDGQEEVGGYTADDVIRTARDKRVAVFAVGFYRQYWQRGQKKDNSKELQILEKIAIQTGGKFIRADASSNLAEIFIQARKRVRNFVVIDCDLCGISRDAAAQSPRVDVQVAYDDCKSNVYPISLPPLEKDLAACPQCRSHADCSTNERCSESSCKTLPCGKCQKAQEHQCADVGCSAGEQCAPDCECQQGKCAVKPPCKEWQVLDSQRNECLGKPCTESAECPNSSECCKGRCEEKHDCSSWMKKDPQSCSCLDIQCRHDGQCPDGVLCDGEYCVSPEGKLSTRATCEDGKFSVNGKCETVKCAKDSDCLDEKSPGKWVCAPRIGLASDDATDRTCQPLDEAPCEEWEEEVDGSCRIVACEKDDDCADAGVCDDGSGDCIAAGLCGKKNLPICLGIGGFGLLAIVFLLVALRRRRAPEEALPESLSPVPPPPFEKGMTQVADPPSPPAYVKGATLGDPALGGSGGRGTMPEARRAAAVSPYTLEIDVQGQVTRQPLPFGSSKLGRETGDVVIPHAIVSSEHLVFEVGEQGISITDLGSTNGTFIQGNRLTPDSRTTVVPGQQIVLGGTVRLTILSGQGGDAPSGSRRKQATVIVD